MLSLPPTKLDILHFNFHCIQFFVFYLSWDFLIYSWIIYLFTSVLFILPDLREFIFFLLLISSLTPLWSEGTFYDFNSFKFVKVYLVVQGIVYFGICSVSTWKKYIFCYCWRSATSYWWWCYWVFLFPCRFSVQLFYWLLRKECWDLQL